MGQQLGLQTSFNLLMEVMANFAKDGTPRLGIAYFAAQVSRLSPDLSDLHPEFLQPLFEKAFQVMDDAPDCGIKLFGALGVDRYLTIEASREVARLQRLLFQLPRSLRVRLSQVLPA